MRQFLAGLVLFIVCAHCDAQTVLPFVDCIDFDAAANEVTAYFSYANGTGAVVAVALGAGNFFSPAPIGRGQPVSFQTGVVRKAFSVAFPAGSTLTWTLLGNTAVAAEDPTAYCYHDDIFKSGFGG